MYYPSASGGMQSPIDVMTEEVTWDPELCHNPLQIWYRMDSSSDSSEGDDHSPTASKESMALENTGNTALINISNSRSC